MSTTALRVDDHLYTHKGTGMYGPENTDQSTWAHTLVHSRAWKNAISAIEIATRRRLSHAAPCNHSDRSSVGTMSASRRLLIFSRETAYNALRSAHTSTWKRWPIMISTTSFGKRSIRKRPCFHREYRSNRSQRVSPMGDMCALKATCQNSEQIDIHANV